MKKLRPKNIPSALEKLRRWSVFKLRYEQGKLKKVPVSPTTGKFLKTTVPHQWESFNNARQAYEMRKWGCVGIGFVFTRQNPYVGIDLDHCRDPKTGAIDPWAQEIIDKAKSYTEISPSCTGVHILVKMKEKPYGLNRRDFGDIEIFASSVFLTVTGDHLHGTPKAIACRDEFVKNLIVAHSKKAPKITTRSKSPATDSAPQTRGLDLEAPNLDKFQRLYSGDWSGYSSQSEADLALCSILASLTGSNWLLMDQLFRNSGLFREKWDEKHFDSGETYGEATIAKAIKTRQLTPK